MTILDKKRELMELTRGDKLKIDTGEEVVFERLKSKRFLGSVDGVMSDIPVEMYVKVLEKVDVEAIELKKEEEYKSLKVGDLFYIEQKGDAILFRFKELKGGRIVGSSYITGSPTRIDVSLYGGKVKM